MRGRRRVCMMGMCLMIVVLTAFAIAPSVSACYIGIEPQDGYNGAPPSHAAGKQDMNVEVFADSAQKAQWDVYVGHWYPIKVYLLEPPDECLYVWFVAYEVSLAVPDGYDMFIVDVDVELHHKANPNAGWVLIEQEDVYIIHDDEDQFNYNGYIYVGHNNHDHVLDEEYLVKVSVDVDLMDGGTSQVSDSGFEDRKYEISPYIPA